jgi:hypothetical protein
LSSVASRAVRKMIGVCDRSAPSRLAFEALHVRQHHVEQDQVRLEVADLAHGVGAGAGRRDREAVEAQGHRDDVDDVGLVVDD